MTKSITIELTKQPAKNGRDLGQKSGLADKWRRSVREHLANVYKSLKPDLGSRKVEVASYVEVVRQHFQNRPLTVEAVGAFLYERETERHKTILEAVHWHLDPVKHWIDTIPGMRDFPFYRER